MKSVFRNANSCSFGVIHLFHSFRLDHMSQHNFYQFWIWNLPLPLFIYDGQLFIWRNIILFDTVTMFVRHSATVHITSMLFLCFPLDVSCTIYSVIIDFTIVCSLRSVFYVTSIFIFCISLLICSASLTSSVYMFILDLACFFLFPLDKTQNTGIRHRNS